MSKWAEKEEDMQEKSPIFDKPEEGLVLWKHHSWPREQKCIWRNKCNLGVERFHSQWNWSKHIPKPMQISRVTIKRGIRSLSESGLMVDFFNEEREIFGFWFLLWNFWLYRLRIGSSFWQENFLETLKFCWKSLKLEENKLYEADF